MQIIPQSWDQIPQELKERPQWVTWGPGIDKQGKIVQKMPFTPNTGTQASSTNPKTWGTFAEAVTACEMQPNLSGIGFVFSAEDPFTGIDLDKCRDSETGEIQSWALDIVRRFNSYAEISPSGTGIHIIVKGSLPSGKRKGRIELYDRGRYFTMTGVLLPCR